jgi:hypothetical protein
MDASPLVRSLRRGTGFESTPDNSLPAERGPRPLIARTATAPDRAITGAAFVFSMLETASRSSLSRRLLAAFSSHLSAQPTHPEAAGASPK